MKSIWENQCIENRRIRRIWKNHIEKQPASLGRRCRLFRGHPRENKGQGWLRIFAVNMGPGISWENLVSVVSAKFLRDTRSKFHIYEHSFLRKGQTVMKKLSNLIQVLRDTLARLSGIG